MHDEMSKAVDLRSCERGRELATGDRAGRAKNEKEQGSESGKRFVDCCMTMSKVYANFDDDKEEPGEQVVRIIKQHKQKYLVRHSSQHGLL
jgi:hypothetical protein